MADRTGGYVSAAALAVVLAMATIAGAVTYRSVAALRQAQRDLESLRADYALAGAQERAMALLASDVADGRLKFEVDTDLGVATILAEPERDKLRLSQGLRDADLTALGVNEPVALQSRLRALANHHPTSEDLATLAIAPDWRACGPSLISAWGEAREAALIAPRALGGAGAGSRLGQVWRLRARLASGWSDERLVRFVVTDDLAAAVIWRSFKRRSATMDNCIGRKARSA